MTSKQNDILLLNLIREGDELAFKRVFESYFVPLCRYMFLFIQEKETVEDLAMDIFTYLWENKNEIQIHTSLKSYLFQAAHNKSLNIVRQRKKILSIDKLDIELLESDDQKLELHELQEFIQSAIMDLPDKCKNVFQLSRFENLSNQEISSQLNISVKTVEAHISKAIKKIRKILGDLYLFFC